MLCQQTFVDIKHLTCYIVFPKPRFTIRKYAIKERAFVTFRLRRMDVYKTESMLTVTDRGKTSIQLGGIILKHIVTFEYLGSRHSNDAESTKVIQTKIT